MRVSVIIPAFNSARTITVALDSVVSQTSPATEILVVDDCSADETCAVVERWIAAHQDAGHGVTVRLIKCTENGGPARARNIGIRQAAGDWIAFLDADDAWLPHRLECEFAACGKMPEAVMFCGGTVPLREEDRKSESGNQKPGEGLELRKIRLEEFVDVNPVSTSTVLVQKAVLEAVGGFDEAFRGPEDLDLWMRIANKGRIICLECPLSRYREVAGSLSNEVKTFLPQVLAVYDKAFGVGGALAAHPEWKRRAVGSRYVSACWTELACGRRWSAFRFLLKSLLVWPGPLKGAKRRAGWRWILFAKIILNKA